MQLDLALKWAARPLPLPVVRRLARTAYARLLAAHPNLFDRLGEHAAKSFVFAPTELPFVFVVRPQAGLDVLRKGALPRADVMLSGPFLTMLMLLEGSADGDALFFARKIEISGDTEAILALRNALDDNAINLPRDLSPLAGPLAGIVRAAMEQFRARATGGERTRQWS
jgi:predicted lipid carrier protein YhbT